MAAIGACLLVAGCAPQQEGSWPASLQLVPAGYYSVKPRYTSSPAPRRGVRPQPAAEPEPRARIRFPTENAPAVLQERDKLDDLEARAAEISEQLREMRRQLE